MVSFVHFQQRSDLEESESDRLIFSDIICGRLSESGNIDSSRFELVLSKYESNESCATETLKDAYHVVTRGVFSRRGGPTY
jgi:hypothetical protein